MVKVDFEDKQLNDGNESTESLAFFNRSFLRLVKSTLNFNLLLFLDL